MRVCARVLAAALITGGIASALVLPALTSQPGGVPRAVSTPPSSHDRTLYLPALQAPARSSPQHHAVVAHQRSTELAAAPISPRPSVVFFKPASVKPATRPVVQPPAPKPRPTPKPVPASSSPAPAADPAPRDLASDPAPAPAAPAPEPDASDDSCTPSSDNEDGQGHGNGNGHAYGHDKQDEASGSNDDAGHGNGKANGHDK